jgi:hypothetical protein
MQRNLLALSLALMSLLAFSSSPARAESSCARDYRLILDNIRINRADEANVRQRLAEARRHLANATDELDREHARHDVEDLEQALRDVRLAGATQRQLAEAMKGLIAYCPQDATPVSGNIQVDRPVFGTATVASVTPDSTAAGGQ